MESRNRNIQIHLRLNEDENYILRQKMKASGMGSLNKFLIHLILYGYVYEVDYSRLRELDTALARIGNNINQIAKHMNETDTVSAEDVRTVKELMGEIWRTQKSILSNQPYTKL